MNKNAKAWVEALRSGKYKQGKSVLARKAKTYRFGELINEEVKYCCLGVACELYAEAHPDFPVGEKREDDAKTYGKHDEIYHLPSEVMEWLNIRDHAGHHLRKGTQERLSLETLNDTGIPFETVADIIEGEPVGLFDTKRSTEKYKAVICGLSYV